MLHAWVALSSANETVQGTKKMHFVCSSYMRLLVRAPPCFVCGSAEVACNVAVLVPCNAENTLHRQIWAFLVNASLPPCLCVFPCRQLQQSGRKIALLMIYYTIHKGALPVWCHHVRAALESRNTAYYHAVLCRVCWRAARSRMCWFFGEDQIWYLEFVIVQADGNSSSSDWVVRHNLTGKYGRSLCTLWK